MNALAYVRVSGKSQVEGDGPERQFESIEKFSKANALDLKAAYEDLAVSGTIEGMDRPKFLECLQAAEGFGAAIVVERLDRLARDLMVQELMMRECRERGVKVFSVDQGQLIDIASNDGDPTRKLMRQIMGALAEWEKSALVLKLRRARDRVRSETGHCEGPTPYGTWKGESEVLEGILEARKAGYPFSSIISRLNELGYKTRTGQPWNKYSVLNVVKKWRKRNERRKI